LLRKQRKTLGGYLFCRTLYKHSQFGGKIFYDSGSINFWPSFGYNVSSVFLSACRLTHVLWLNRTF